ncbi:MAG: GNAT family N-acetyltransferase [Candidatus Cryosericum sp.]
MSATRILPVAVRNAGDLATICAGEGAKSDPLWERATKAKRQWVRERLAELGTFAWVAYNGADPIGMIQCHPERDPAGVGVAVIDCIWVPKKSRWGRGIGSKLLAEVETTMQRQHRWFDGKPADGMAAVAFHGESEGQQSAESFYLHHGFVHMDGESDLMFKPFLPETVWVPTPRAVAAPTSLPDDDARVTVLLGPLSCPFQYRILSQTGTYVGEKLGMTVTEVDAVADPEGYLAHGGLTGILVKGHVLGHNLLQREKLDEELRGL